ncbi:hypothetical protein E2C01_098254 [Portunus trituberculatus]|uniref:Uncharacterized protein n=1 Tax=Portunus trituberculatus TaxID=210409 RepID=A0A5B7KBN3_PORTR|nr:hypothetical protein [Portunus trituberculatus]
MLLLHQHCFYFSGFLYVHSPFLFYLFKQHLHEDLFPVSPSLGCEGRRVARSRAERRGEGEEESACGGRTVAGEGWPGRVGAWSGLTYARRAHRLRARGPRRTSRRGRAQPTTQLAHAGGDVAAGRHHGSHE